MENLLDINIKELKELCIEDLLSTKMIINSIIKTSPKESKKCEKILNCINQILKGEC